MPIPLIQPNFSRGEVSEDLYGRVDTAIYQAALRTARNVVAHAYGGVSNRPGFQHLGPCGSNTDTIRLIPFKFKTTDTYILEFGNLYMRVVRNDAYVLESTVAITGATVANPVVITATSHGYSNGDMVYIASVGGMTEINARFFLVSNSTANTFELQSPYGAGNIDGTGYTAYTSGGTVARVYTLTTVYDHADLANLKFDQSADVMNLTHNSYPAYELTRTDHAAWTLTVKSAAVGVGAPDNVTATQNGTTGSTTYEYVVLSVDVETGEESTPGWNGTSKAITAITKANPAVVTATAHGYSDGDLVYIRDVGGMDEVTNRVFIIDGVTTNTFELQGVDSTNFSTYTGGGTAEHAIERITNGNATLSVTDNISITWTPLSGAARVRYAVYRRKNGIFGFLGETELASYTDDGSLSPNLDITLQEFRYPFIGSGNYPGAVGRFQQRLVFGGSDNNPDTSEYTRVGQEKSFARSSPTQDNDAISATLASSEVDEIRHYVSLNDLLVLTSGAEWRVTGTDTAGFTPGSINQLPQSRWGSSHIRPVNSGEVVLFVQDDKRTLRSLGFSLDVDGYTGTDLTLLAHHLFRTSSMVEMALSRAPDPLVAVVKDDGDIAALTFNQEQQVVAWTHWDSHKANGSFKSVAVVRPSATDADEVIYVVVRRTINGNQVQFLERLHSRRFTDIRDCFFVDSGLSLDNPVTISGATAANPVVITATSHGFSNGDEVDIHDITWTIQFDSLDNESQPDQLNGRRYTVANVTANTFELTDSDGNNIDGSAYKAYVSGGTARKVETTLTGFHHLEGETLVALADGNVVTGLTVSGGQITLPRGASRVHAGLQFIADIETLDVERSTSTLATIQNQKVHVPAVTVRLARSRGLWVGPSNTKLVEMKQRELEDIGDPTALLTGDKTIRITSRWDTNGRIFLRQRDPLPLTILAIIPEVERERE